MKRLIVLLAIALPGLAWLFIANRTGTAPAPPVPPALEQFRRLNHLVTIQAPISTVYRKTVAGYTGSLEIIVLVRGEVELSVNLDDATFDAIDEQARTAVLKLPEPVPRRPRLDHRATQVFKIQRTGLWSMLPVNATDARTVTAALSEAQAALQTCARDPSLVAEARCRAQENLSRFTASLGWTVEVRWVPP